MPVLPTWDDGRQSVVKIPNPRLTRDAAMSASPDRMDSLGQPPARNLKVVFAAIEDLHMQTSKPLRRIDP